MKIKKEHSPIYKLKTVYNTSYSTTGSEAVGTVFWNSTDGTLSVKLNNGSTLDMGQELYFYGKASGNIANGELVQFAGVQGDHILIKKVVPAEVIANPTHLVGVATQDITNGSFGYVTWIGYVNDVYTDTPENQDDADWVAGDILYFSNTTGQLTKTEPQAPEVRIEVAAVVKVQTGASQTGKLLVRPTFGQKLVNLDDVNGTAPSANGDLLVWDNDNGYFDFTDNIGNYLKLDGSNANTTINIQGQALRIGGASDIVQQIIKGNVSQTANLQEWQNSSGTVLTKIGSNGDLQTLINSFGANSYATSALMQIVSSTHSGSASMSFQTNSINSSGTVSSSYGIFGRNYHNPSGTGLVTSSYGAEFSVTQQSTKSAISFAGVRSLFNASSGLGTVSYANNFIAESAISSIFANLRGFSVGHTINANCTNNYGFYMTNPSGTGAITTLAGIYIESLTRATNNYAIYTNSGLNRLGDQLSIVGSADRQQLIVKSNATQTANLTEWQNSSGTVGLMVDPTATKFFIGTGTTNTTASRLFITETSTNTSELSQIYAQRLMTNPLTNRGGMNMSIQSAHTTADFSGQNIGGIFQAWIRNTNTKNWTSSGEVNQLGLVGLEARVEVRSGASGTISWLAGLVTDGEFNNNSTATVTNYAGFKIFEPVNAGSLLGFTNNYGLYVGDMTAATNNYAVYTGTGLVRFGDKVIFTQTDGNEYIDSEADGYLTIGATSGVLINKMLYGSMYGDDIAHTVTISSAGVYYAITAGLTGGESNGMTFQNNRELLVTVAGKYRVTWSMSLECGSAGQYVEGAVMVNSTAQSNTVGASELPSANKKVNVAGSGIISLAVNDVVKLCVENETGANNITVDHANIELLRIGD